MIEVKDRQLYVDNELFIIRGAELQNSSMSSAEYMKPIWKKLRDFNLNTVLGAVTWDQIEPEQGTFDFSHIKQCIEDARAEGLKLVILYFGAYKNGMSSYAPKWVKTDPLKYPRACVGDDRTPIEHLSVFSDALAQADANAFSKLMSFIKEIDELDQTVLLVQCENEVGLLGDSLDRSDKSLQMYRQTVPQELVDIFRNDWSSFHPTLMENFKDIDFKKNASSWEEFFGDSVHTHELFMAYHYAKYVEYVASAGKRSYNIPIYTNAWQNQSGELGEAAGGDIPGIYPSGGPIASVLDIWMRFAPTLSFLSPDVYLNSYEERCRWYTHRNQPLFIPEQRRDEFGACNMWRALGEYGAIGACPFGIDTLESTEWESHLGLLKQVEPWLVKARKEKLPVTGFYFNDSEACGITKILGDYELFIERARVFGKPGLGYGLIINTSPDNFLFAGAGYQVTFGALVSGKLAGIARVIEREVLGDQLRPLRWLNGDESQSGKCVMMPSEEPDYGDFPVAITIPANTKVATVETYQVAIIN